MRTRAVAVAACITGFFVVAFGVGSRSGLSSIDESVWRFFTHHTGATQRSVARTITSLGVAGFLSPVAILVGVAAWWRTKSTAIVVVPVVVVQVTSLIVRKAKGHYMVARPATAPAALIAHNPAFPSGHTANTAAFLTVAALLCSAGLSRRSRGWMIAFAVAGTVVMGWTRLALGVHWFSDVVGGALLGSTIGLCGASVALWWLASGSGSGPVGVSPTRSRPWIRPRTPGRSEG